MLVFSSEGSFVSFLECLYGDREEDCRWIPARRCYDITIENKCCDACPDMKNSSNQGIEFIGGKIMFAILKPIMSIFLFSLTSISRLTGYYYVILVNVTLVSE